MQYAVENVPGLARYEGMNQLGEPVTVEACAYGRLSKKTYLLWLSPETKQRYLRIQRHAATDCPYCSQGLDHPHAHAPAKGSTQSRVKEDGKTNEAARNRVPPMLAQAVGRCMREAWEEAHDG